jgi:hypothetical protein
MPVSGTETGSFCWIDGSHRVYADEWHAKRSADGSDDATILGESGESKGHYCVLPGDHLLATKSVSIFRHLPAGSCVLWDSALVHANVAPAPGSPSSTISPPPAKRARRDPSQPSLYRFFHQANSAPRPPPQLRRLTAYVTMAPASNVRPDALGALGDNHVAAAQQGQTTSHWPDVHWPSTLRFGNRNTAPPIAACCNRTLSVREEALLRGT